MLNTKNLGIDKFERQLDSLLDGDLNEFESLKFDEKLNEIDNNPIISNNNNRFMSDII
jgi:hypothetical protein